MKRIAILGVLILSIALAPGVTSGALSSWYTDVPDHDVYYDGIYYLTQAEDVSGYEDGTFKPDQDVSRVEALKMILEALDIAPAGAEASFSDIDPEAWYYEYLNTGVGLEIVSGDPEGTFRPNDTVNRAEAVKMLILASGKRSELPNIANDDWYSAYMAYAQEHALLVPDAIGDYHPAASLSRGELADLIYRFKEEPYMAQVEYGVASYYGYSYDGHNTASGNALNAYGYMAAHKTLPFGTILRVTNIYTNTYVDVEVVDRGPYTPGYVVDLTPAAFEQLGDLSQGLIQVRVEVLK